MVEVAGCCPQALSAPDQHQGLFRPTQHLRRNLVMLQMNSGGAADVCCGLLFTSAKRIGCMLRCCHVKTAIRDSMQRHKMLTPESFSSCTIFRR